MTDLLIPPTPEPAAIEAKPDRVRVQTTTLAGRVVSVDPARRCFGMRCRSGALFQVFLGPTTTYEVLSNVDGVSRDRTVDRDPGATGDERIRIDLERYVAENALVFVRGIEQETTTSRRFEARIVYLLQSSPQGPYVFEETHWWLAQISRLGDRWLDQLFDARRDYTVDDFSKFYHTNLNILGLPTDDSLQECATLSRLIYGLSSAYLLTGLERYYLAASAAVNYQRQAFRSLTSDGEHCFWAFGRRRTMAGEKLLFASEAGDDAGTIPLYEQIYALAGLAQYYRITADWEVLEDIRRTLRTFEEFYHDEADRADGHRGLPGHGGWFSHLDHVTMRPDAPALRHNQSRKNWNSIGDHIPAYLVNLILSMDPVPQGTGRVSFTKLRTDVIKMLDECVELILQRFPDRNSAFVNERFLADWTPDHEYSWQQNRAIVGHNMKIAWNLTRCAFYYQHRSHDAVERDEEREAAFCDERARSCLDLARELGDEMARVGVDQWRGGIFDAVEREPRNGMPVEFAWGATKDFWQQEQAVLGYLLLYGATRADHYLDLARECMAFWNLFFLDRDRQGIFFRTNESGVPIIEGVYGQKGSHAVAGYHSFELNFLAHLYLRSYVERDPQDRGYCLYFHPVANREQRTINVLPDFSPPNRVHIRRIVANGVDRTDELRPEANDDFQIRIDNIERNPRDGAIDLVVEFGIH